jgi:hypothetical protein
MRHGLLVKDVALSACYFPIVERLGGLFAAKVNEVYQICLVKFFDVEQYSERAIVKRVLAYHVGESLLGGALVNILKVGRRIFLEKIFEYKLCLSAAVAGLLTVEVEFDGIVEIFDQLLGAACLQRCPHVVDDSALRFTNMRKCNEEKKK